MRPVLDPAQTAGLRAIASRPGRSPVPEKNIAVAHSIPDALERASVPAHLLKSYAGLHFGSLEKTSGVAQAPPPERMTFDDFLQLVKQNPRKYIPTTKQYFVSGLESWGTREESILGEKVKVYNFANRPWLTDAVTDRDEFQGQEPVIHEIVETLKKVDNGKAPYVIQLIGPNGVGKSQLMDLMQEAVEIYSRKPGGERYTFSIISADQKYKGVQLMAPGVKGRIGGSRLPKEEDISFRLPSALNVNPLFLLSREERSDLIKSLKAEGKLDEKANYDFFITGGDLDKRSRTLIDALRRHYDGDLNKVFRNHIQVERFDFPKGIIPAAESPHAEVRQLTQEVQWNKAPRVLLNSGALFDYNGYMPRANNGSINIDDMGRSVRADFTYLLETAQTGRLLMNSAPGHPMMSVQEPVDIIFFSTANPEGLKQIMQGGNFRALKDRTIYITVPHERRYQSEAKVHGMLYERAKANGRKIAPHVEETYALWATMTRLLPVNTDYKEYSRSTDNESGKLKSALGKIDMLKKALLYQEDSNINSYKTDPNANDYIRPAEYEVLKRHLKAIAGEHRQSTGETNFSDYEGSFGISARDGDKVVVPAIIGKNKDRPLTVMDVFETLSQYIKTEPLWLAERNGHLEKHPMKSKTPTVKELLKQVEDHSRRQFLTEVRTALQVYQTPAEHIRILEKYLEHIRALTADGTEEKEVKAEFRDNQNFKAPNQKFIDEVEQAILLSGERNKQGRVKLQAKLAAWDMSKGSADNIKRLFSSELDRMRAYDEKSSEERIKKFLKDTALRQTNPGILAREAAEGVERKKEIDRMEQAIANLSKLGYPPESLPKLLGWAFGKGYISDETLEVYGT